MQDMKMVVGIVLGSALIVILMIFGLSKMSQGEGASVVIDQSELTMGALLKSKDVNTKVTVVNFSDVQCPACKDADLQLKGLRDMEGVTFIYRHFPLSIHKNALISARAVEAARQLGKGWEMLDLLFDKQNEWAEDRNPEGRFVEYAKSIGLDEKGFQTALNSSNTEATVSADLALSNRLKLNGTPSIFVNGELTATQFVEGKVSELLKQ